MKAALSCRIRIAAGPRRQCQLRRFRAEVAEHRIDKQMGFDRILSGVVIDGRKRLTYAEISMIAELVAQVFYRLRYRGAGPAALQAI